MAMCWINGEVMDAAQARVSVFDRGLLYGDGVFEGIRFYNHRVFRLQRHLQRLQDSATAIGLPLPLSLQALAQAIHEVIAAYAQADGYLRLVVTRGEGPLGINPASCKHPTTFIIADRLGFVAEDIRQRGARLVIASTRRLSADGLDPRIKSLNYLNHILARMEANHAQADEAILLNASGHVSEGSSDNVFIVRDRQLFTPPVTDGALDGVTRGVVLELARELGIPSREKTLAPYDLYTADECFLTGTAVELVPVREIDGRVLPSCPGHVFHRLQTGFIDLTQRETGYTPADRAQA